MSAPQLRKVLDNLTDQIGSRRMSQKDSFSVGLDANVQGYIVTPAIVLKEMNRPESPFLVNVAGNSVPSSERKRLSKIISKDLYNEYKIFAKTSGLLTFNIRGNMLPEEFLSSPKKAIAFDDTIRTIYYKSTGKVRNNSSKSNYLSFRKQVRTPVERLIKARPDALDPTRIYVSPDKNLGKAWDKMAKELRQQIKADKPGISSGAVDNRVSRAKKEFLEGRPNPWQGLELGHVFGSKATGLITFLKNPEDIFSDKKLADIELLESIPAVLAPAVRALISTVIDVDTSLELEKTVRNNIVNTTVTYLIPQSALGNKSGGGSISGAVSGSKGLANIINRLEKAIPDMKASLSHRELLVDYVERLFLGKPIKKISTRTKVKKRSRVKKTVQSRSIGSTTVKVRQTRSDKGKIRGPNIAGLLNNVVNPRLHDQIRKNMGKGRSKKILNYRTGRFARSAKVLNLNSSSRKSSLEAVVKYQKNPYNRFEVGGDLHLPGRDPKRIFGISIRQILQEQKIATLTRVLVDLV